MRSVARIGEDYHYKKRTGLKKDVEKVEGRWRGYYDFDSGALHDTLRHALDIWRDQDAWRANAQRRCLQRHQRLVFHCTLQTDERAMVPRLAETHPAIRAKHEISAALIAPECLDEDVLTVVACRRPRS